jgi:hypothetical protein
MSSSILIATGRTAAVDMANSKKVLQGITLLYRTMAYLMHMVSALGQYKDGACQGRIAYNDIIAIKSEQAS